MKSEKSYDTNYCTLSLSQKLQELDFFAGHRLVKVAKTASTNDDLKERWQKESAAPKILIAGEQTAGRGQYNRSWLSRPGQALTFSFDFSVDNRGFALSLLIGLSLVNALRGIVACPEVLWLKWPNDVWAGRKKLAGILVESCITGTRQRVVAGIGVNLAPLRSEQIHSSSVMELGGDISPEDLVYKILQNLNFFMRLPAEEQRQLWTVFAGRFWNTDFIVNSEAADILWRPIALQVDGALIVQAPGQGTKTVYSASLLPALP